MTLGSPELAPGLEAMVNIESEITLGMGVSDPEEGLSGLDGEAGGGFQVRAEKMGKLYLGGEALWWFIGALTSAVFGVVFGIWGMVEWSNLGEEPDWASLVFVFMILPIVLVVGSAVLWLYWVSIINVRTGRVNKVFNKDCPEFGRGDAESKVQ